MDTDEAARVVDDSSTEHALPELGGHTEDKTPKQRLLNWMQNKVPGVPINNFTSDWTDGVKVGALVDSVAPGLCPDWEDWDPNEPIR